MKYLKKYAPFVSALCLTSLVGSQNPSFAQEEEKVKEPNLELMLGQSNKYRSIEGFEFYNKPVTEAQISAEYLGLEVYSWAVQENKTMELNEVDLGASYSFSFGNEKHSLTTRAGFDIWFFTKEGGNFPNLSFGLGYDGPFNLDFNSWHSLDFKESSFLASASKDFIFGKGDGKTNPLITPYITSTCIDNFLGFSSCPSNTVLGLSLSTGDGKTSVSFSGEYHIGGKNFEDSVIGRVSINHSFLK